MDIYTWWATATLVLAITVNTFTVHSQKKYKIYNKYFGKSAQVVHVAIISVVWGAFVLAAYNLNQSDWRLLQAYPLGGAALLLLALVIFVAAYVQIGSDGIVNANFFGKKTKKLQGIYNFMPEPMYVSYTLLLLGLAVRTGIKGYFLLAIIAAVGFAVESRVESVDS